MYILGINSVYHESSAAILKNGKTIAAVEEERFNRLKHGKKANVDNPHHIPESSIRYCMKEANILPKDLKFIAFSFDPKLRKKMFQPDPISLKGSWGDQRGEEKFLSCLNGVIAALSTFFDFDIEHLFNWVPHHLAHASSAFYPSGEQNASIFVIDGIAENASTMLAYGEDHQIEVLKEIQYPHSIGFLWEKISSYLGFSEYDASKVMGMAAYGDSNTFKKEFSSFAQIQDGYFNIDNSILNFRTGFDGLENIFGKKRLASEKLKQKHFDLAAILQEFTENAKLNLLKKLYKLKPSRTVCIAGGVGLNCLSNYRIMQQSPFEKVFIPPGPHDAGTSIGSALYLSHYLEKKDYKIEKDLNPFTGPEFSDNEIEEAINFNGFKINRIENKEVKAAQMISEQKIIGWFQGRMEFGPRALGNRSLLCDPRFSRMRDIINNKVKHRENFRPFAPSILKEEARSWFKIGSWSDSFHFMLLAPPVQDDKINLIKAVVHVDNTSRIQVVDQKFNPTFYRLICQFFKITGVPIVLNTSFNDCEPIVCSPYDAIETFKKTMIDALFIGDYLLMREEISL
ncbi:carbamoyltransferase [Candidatus Magnetomorum sp. HK-1]|nr:carbamoyltransferase [Candidatus Magnetomorum sp. HK-1]